MKVFFLDLWMDLREKRLAPVAIILLAGLIAVPLVLANGNDETATTPTPTTPTATVASAAVIKGQPSVGSTDSKLQTFSSRDPFEPTVRVVQTSTSTTTSGGGSSTTSTSTGTSGTTGTTGTSGTTGSTGTSGGGTTGSQPTTTTPSGTGNTTGETKTTLFTYTVDLRFGRGGDVKAYKNVKRLELVPTADNPKLVFLGVTTTGKTAVFLVDNNIGVDTAGGKCRPSADECTFLYLRPDADHDLAQLTDSDGTVYHLRLLDINRVTVSSSNGSTSNGSGGSKNNSSSRSPAFTGNAKRKSSSNDATVPGQDSPPGEPTKRSSFQQFFADSAQ